MKLLGLLLLKAHLLLYGDLLFSFVRVKTSFYAHESFIVAVVHGMILSEAWAWHWWRLCSKQLDV